MTKIRIERSKLEKWAGYLIDHSLGGITSEDRVMIKGEAIAWPLISVLESRIIQAGGVPDIYLVPPNNERGRVWSAAMARLGSVAQLGSVPSWHKARYDSMTKYIEVLGAQDTSQYSDLSAEQVGRLAQADQPFAEIRLSKPWVLTLFPTEDFARMEGLDIDTYVSFIVEAVTTDPVPLKEAEQRIEPVMARADRIEIQTHHPQKHRDLTLVMGLRQSLPVMSYGLRNFPDGEIFTSPDANTPEGEIFLDLPVHYGGNDIKGIYLKLEKGRIVEYSAQEGGEHLAAIIETDEGSHRLGEVALGMNPGLHRVLKHPLFVEKVGGTLHVAIGAGFEGAFVEDPSTEESKALIKELEAEGKLNRSAQHIDIVADFRENGCGRRVVLGDTVLKVRDRVWVP